MLPDFELDTPAVTESTRTPRMEHCGNCNAEVPASADICSRCGALLAAYRNPLDPADDLVLTVAPVGTTAAPEAVETAKATSKPVVVVPAAPPSLVEAPSSMPVAAAEPIEVFPLLVVTPPDDVDLRAARERFVRTLAAPERELLAALPVPVPAQPIPVTITPPKAKTEPPATAAAKAAPRRIVPLQPPVPVVMPEPRKPGFIVKGSVPAVLLWGLALILASCVVFLIASAAAGSQFGTLVGIAGLLFGITGAICVVFGMLVYLVRREADR